MIKRYSSYTKDELLAKRAKLEEDLAILCMQWEEDTDLEIIDFGFDRQGDYPGKIMMYSYISMGDELFAQLKKDD